MWVVAVVECEEDLHEIGPDGVFWDGAARALGLFDDGGQVAAAAVLHDNIENAGVTVDVAVMVADDVFVMEVFEDVSDEMGVRVRYEWLEKESEHFCNNLFAVSLGHALKVEFLSSKYLGRR